MKLCTLKVAEAARGQRLGELLVKAALLDAIDRGLSGLSLTIYDKHTDLISMLTDLGFVDTGDDPPWKSMSCFAPSYHLPAPSWSSTASSSTAATARTRCA